MLNMEPKHGECVKEVHCLNQMVEQVQVVAMFIPFPVLLQEEMGNINDEIPRITAHGLSKYEQIEESGAE